MFCKNCGAQYDDAQAFCPQCGAKNDLAAPAKSGSVIDKIKNNKTAKIGIIAVVAVVVVVIVISLFSGNGAEKALKNYLKGYEKYEASYLINAAPKDYIEDYLDDAEDFDDKQDMIDAYQETLDERAEEEDEDIGGNIKITYKIVDSEKLTKDQLKDYKKYLKKYYDYKADVTAGYSFGVKLTSKGDDGKETYYTDYTVIKVNGKWVPYSAFGFYFGQ